MRKRSRFARTWLRAVSVVTLSLFLLNNAYGLSPNSRLSPNVKIEQGEDGSSFNIVDDGSAAAEFSSAFKDDFDFIFLSRLIGDVLSRYPKSIDAEGLKMLIENHMKGKDYDGFKRFKWEGLERKGDVFYLPYENGDRKLTLCYYLKGGVVTMDAAESREEAEKLALSASEESPDMSASPKEITLHEERRPLLEKLIASFEVFRIGKKRTIKLERHDNCPLLKYIAEKIKSIPKWFTLRKNVADRLDKIRFSGAMGYSALKYVFDQMRHDDVERLSKAAELRPEIFKSRLLKIAENTDILLVCGRLTICDKGVFGHARRGVISKERGAAIWLGEKLFLDSTISDEDIAQLLLEEAVHILIPDLDHQTHLAVHSQALTDKLTAIAKELGEEVGARGEGDTAKDGGEEWVSLKKDIPYKLFYIDGKPVTIRLGMADRRASSVQIISYGNIMRDRRLKSALDKIGKGKLSSQCGYFAVTYHEGRPVDVIDIDDESGELLINRFYFAEKGKDIKDSDPRARISRREHLAISRKGDIFTLVARSESASYVAAETEGDLVMDAPPRTTPAEEKIEEKRHAPPAAVTSRKDAIRKKVNDLSRALEGGDQEKALDLAEDILKVENAISLVLALVRENELEMRDGAVQLLLFNVFAGKDRELAARQGVSPEDVTLLLEAAAGRYGMRENIREWLLTIGHLLNLLDHDIVALDNAEMVKIESVLRIFFSNNFLSHVREWIETCDTLSEEEKKDVFSEIESHKTRFQKYAEDQAREFEEAKAKDRTDIVAPTAYNSELRYYVNVMLIERFSEEAGQVGGVEGDRSALVINMSWGEAPKKRSIRPLPGNTPAAIELARSIFDRWINETAGFSETTDAIKKQVSERKKREEKESYKEKGLVFALKDGLWGFVTGLAVDNMGVEVRTASNEEEACVGENSAPNEERAKVKLLYEECAAGGRGQDLTGDEAALLKDYLNAGFVVKVNDNIWGVVWAYGMSMINSKCQKVLRLMVVGSPAEALRLAQEAVAEKRAKYAEGARDAEKYLSNLERIQNECGRISANDTKKKAEYLCRAGMLVSAERKWLEDALISVRKAVDDKELVDTAEGVTQEINPVRSSERLAAALPAIEKIAREAWKYDLTPEQKEAITRGENLRVYLANGEKQWISDVLRCVKKKSPAPEINEDEIKEVGNKIFDQVALKLNDESDRFNSYVSDIVAEAATRWGLEVKGEELTAEFRGDFDHLLLIYWGGWAQRMLQDIQREKNISKAEERRKALQRDKNAIWNSPERGRIPYASVVKLAAGGYSERYLYYLRAIARCAREKGVEWSEGKELARDYESAAGNYCFVRPENWSPDKCAWNRVPAGRSSAAKRPDAAKDAEENWAEAASIERGYEGYLPSPPAGAVATAEKNLTELLRTWKERKERLDRLAADFPIINEIYEETEEQYEDMRGELERNGHDSGAMCKDYDVTDALAADDERSVTIFAARRHKPRQTALSVKVDADFGFFGEAEKNEVIHAANRDKEAVKEVIELLPPDLRFCRFGVNKPGILGFALNKVKMIGLCRAIADDPLAKFHEAGHYLLEEGILKFSLSPPSGELIVFIRGMERARMNVFEHGDIMAHLKLEQWNNLDKTRKVTNVRELLALICEDSHYLLRLYGRYAFGSLPNMGLTSEIKRARQAGLEREFAAATPTAGQIGKRAAVKEIIIEGNVKYAVVVDPATGGKLTEAKLTPLAAEGKEKLLARLKTFMAAEQAHSTMGAEESERSDRTRLFNRLEEKIRRLPEVKMCTFSGDDKRTRDLLGFYAKENDENGLLALRADLMGDIIFSSYFNLDNVELITSCFVLFHEYLTYLEETGAMQVEFEEKELIKASRRSGIASIFNKDTKALQTELIVRFPSALAGGQTEEVRFQIRGEALQLALKAMSCGDVRQKTHYLLRAIQRHLLPGTDRTLTERIEKLTSSAEAAEKTKKRWLTWEKLFVGDRLLKTTGEPAGTVAAIDREEGVVTVKEPSGRENPISMAAIEQFLSEKAIEVASVVLEPGSRLALGLKEEYRECRTSLLGGDFEIRIKPGTSSFTCVLRPAVLAENGAGKRVMEMRLYGENGKEVSGPKERMTLVPDMEYVIGQKISPEEYHFRVPDARTSARHVSVEFAISDKGRYCVEIKDLGSKNGTEVELIAGDESKPTVVSNLDEEAQEIIRKLRTLDYEAARSGQKAIIGIGTSWIPNEQREKGAVKVLLDTLEKLPKCPDNEFKNLIIEHDSDPADLARKIERTREKAGAEKVPLSNVVILEAADVIEGTNVFKDFVGDGKENAAFFAKLRVPEEGFLSKDGVNFPDIDLICVLNKALAGALDKNAPRSFYVDLPRMVEIPIDRINTMNRNRAKALEKAA